MSGLQNKSISSSMARKSPGRKRPDGASPNDNALNIPQIASFSGAGTPVRKALKMEVAVVNSKKEAFSPHQTDVVREYITENLCDGDLSVLVWWENLTKLRAVGGALAEHSQSDSKA